MLVVNCPVLTKPRLAARHPSDHAYRQEVAAVDGSSDGRYRRYGCWADVVRVGAGFTVRVALLR